MNRDAGIVKQGGMSLVLALILLCLSGARAQTGELTGEYNEAYYVLNSLNAGLSDEPVNLQTPQAALEYFVLRARANDFAAAARALNLNLLPESEQLARAPALAEQLYIVLDRKNIINWDEVSDRPDAQAETVPGASNPVAGQPRRSVLLDTEEIDGRDIAVRLQRVRVGESAPVWVFSPNTVENIPALFDQFGPGPIDRAMPEWALARPFVGVPLWEWGALLLLILLCAGVGWAAGKLSEWLFRRSKSGLVTVVTGRLLRPVAFAVAFGLLFALTSGGLLLSGAVLGVMRPLTWVLFIGALTWVGMRLIALFTERFERRSKGVLEEGYDDRAQKQLTVLSIVRRVFIFLIVLVGFGVGLSQFTSLQLLGTTLLTSAGIASVVIGIAAQPVLGNIVAGIQLAITQPVRIGDSVYIEENWGYVEDLGYTFAQVRTWDDRRLLVPLRYLVTEPYENWTLDDAHITKPIYLYADYRVDVGKVREKFTELLKASDDWDERQEPTVQVTSVSDDAVEIRALCSAKDPAAAWSLHCELRERMVAYLQDLEQGRYLPQRRLILQNETGTSSETSFETSSGRAVSRASTPKNPTSEKSTSQTSVTSS